MRRKPPLPPTPSQPTLEAGPGPWPLWASGGPRTQAWELPALLAPHPERLNRC